MKKLFTLFASFAFLLAFGFSFTQLKAAEPTRTIVDVTIKAYFDANNVVNQTGITADYGRNVSLSIDNFSGTSSYSFAFWIVNGQVRRDLTNVNQSFKVSENSEYIAVFKPTGQVVALFMDSNGKMIAIQYLASGATPSEPKLLNISNKPGYQIASENKWGVALGAITTDTVYTLQYEPAGSVSRVVTVTNGSGSNATAAYNSVVTAVADTPAEGQYFNHWINTNTSEVLSLNSTYSFTVINDVSIQAVFSGTPNATNLPKVSLGNNLESRAGYNTFVGQVYLPAGYTLVEYGMIGLNSSAPFTLNTESVNKFQASRILSTTNEWIMSLRDYNSKYVRAYAVVETPTDEIATYYSRQVAAPERPELYFSEYGEGSSNNKWIEIYNPTGSSVDLSSYSVILYSNGSSTASQTASLSGTLSSGDVFVICNVSSNATIKAQCDLEHAVANYNGDDALGLLKGSQLLDQFGVIGQDPGTFWSVGAGATENYTLIRVSSIKSPNSVWTTSEWAVQAIDYFTDLGSHQAADVVSISITGGTTVMLQNTLQLSVTYTPTNSIRGVTWSSSNNDIATVNSSGLVTTVGVGEVTITATSTNNPSVSDTHTVSVTETIYYTVTFDSNEGTEVSSQQVITGRTATQPTNPTRSGYTFGGWYIDDITFANLFSFSTAINQATTLYAKWNSSGSEVVLRQSDFGTTNNSTADYSATITQDVNNGSVDSNPSGTSSWSTKGSNYNNTSWNYVRMGGKSASSIASPNVFMKTNYTFSTVITKIEVNIVGLDSATGLEKIYLQISSDGTTWTDVANLTISATGVQTFSSLNIATGNYIRFVFERASTSSNAGSDVKTITFYGIQ